MDLSLVDHVVAAAAAVGAGFINAVAGGGTLISFPALLAVGVDAAKAGAEAPLYAQGFGFVALVLASVNIFGGFLVTQRMLAMYKKKG